MPNCSAVSIEIHLLKEKNIVNAHYQVCRAGEKSRMNKNSPVENAHVSVYSLKKHYNETHKLQAAFQIKRLLACKCEFSPKPTKTFPVLMSSQSYFLLSVYRQSCARFASQDILQLGSILTKGIIKVCDEHFF